MAWTLLQGDALEQLKTLPDESIHCCVTSPPYWGLRDYGVAGQMGLEPTPDEYVSKMVEVFREVKRVLRDDGTLWLNLGDSYNGSGGAGGDYSKGGLKEGQPKYPGRKVATLKPKDLVGIPWMVAFALRADGWYLRQDIIWAKGNPMPESVKDRCTKAHEYIFLLSKSRKYYFEQQLEEYQSKPQKPVNKNQQNCNNGYTTDRFSAGYRDYYSQGGRNKRSVWSINTKPFKEAHFAVFPPEIPEICIKAGTSPMACPHCGAPWKRVVERERTGEREVQVSDRKGLLRNDLAKHAGRIGEVKVTTLGWEPTCSCGIEETVPCTVLDPFAGSGTTLWVAEQLDRNSIGIELNPKYCEIIRRRMARIEPNLFNLGQG